MSQEILISLLGSPEKGISTTDQVPTFQEPVVLAPNATLPVPVVTASGRYSLHSNVLYGLCEA